MAIRVSQIGKEVWLTNQSNIRVSQIGKEVWRTTAALAPTVGHADGQASVAGVYAPGFAAGHADGFATAQAFPPSHGNADGFATIFGTTIAAATARGNADGLAIVLGFAGVPASGHADGFSNVFSSPGGLTGKTGAAWLIA